MTSLSRRDPAGIFLSFSFLHLHLPPTLEPLNLEEPMDTWIFLTVICIILGAGCCCLAMFSVFKDPVKSGQRGKQILTQLFWRGKVIKCFFFLSFTLHQKITKHRESYFEFHKQWCNTGTPNRDESLKKSIITLHFPASNPQSWCALGCCSRVGLFSGFLP